MYRIIKLLFNNAGRMVNKTQYIKYYREEILKLSEKLDIRN
jgi:hypothetical protein